MVEAVPTRDHTQAARRQPVVVENNRPPTSLQATVPSFPSLPKPQKRPLRVHTSPSKRPFAQEPTFSFSPMRTPASDGLAAMLNSTAESPSGISTRPVDKSSQAQPPRQTPLCHGDRSARQLQRAVFAGGHQQQIAGRLHVPLHGEAASKRPRSRGQRPVSSEKQLGEATQLLHKLNCRAIPRGDDQPARRIQPRTKMRPSACHGSKACAARRSCEWSAKTEEMI